MLRMALPTSRPPPSIARLGRWARIPYPSSAPNSATSSSWTSVYTLMSTGRGVRPETWPRDLGARCPRSGGADEERRERPPGRERAPQEATPEMGCMGPKDPAGFPAAPLVGGARGAGRRGGARGPAPAVRGGGTRPAPGRGVGAHRPHHLALDAAQRALGVRHGGRAGAGGRLCQLALQQPILLDQLLDALPQTLDQIGTTQTAPPCGRGPRGRRRPRSPRPAWSRRAPTGRVLDRNVSHGALVSCGCVVVTAYPIRFEV